MADEVWTAMVFRRHQCSELGWEWYKSISGFPSKAEARVGAVAQIERSMWSGLLPKERSRFKYRIVKGDSEQSEAKEKDILRELNVNYMAERRKWPTLVTQLDEVTP